MKLVIDKYDDILYYLGYHHSGLHLGLGALGGTWLLCLRRHSPSTHIGLLLPCLLSPPCLLFLTLLYPLKWVTWSRGGPPPGRSVQLRVKPLAWAYQEQAANQLPCLSLV